MTLRNKNPWPRWSSYLLRGAAGFLLSGILGFGIYIVVALFSGWTGGVVAYLMAFGGIGIFWVARLEDDPNRLITFIVVGFGMGGAISVFLLPESSPSEFRALVVGFCVGVALGLLHPPRLELLLLGAIIAIGFAGVAYLVRSSIAVGSCTSSGELFTALSAFAGFGALLTLSHLTYGKRFA